MRYSINDPIFRRFIEHLHSLGPRALGEFVIAGADGIPLAVLIEQYDRLTHEALFISGADDWPSIHPHLVPDADK